MLRTLEQHRERVRINYLRTKCFMRLATLDNEIATEECWITFEFFEGRCILLDKLGLISKPCFYFFCILVAHCNNNNTIMLLIYMWII